MKQILHKSKVEWPCVTLSARTLVTNTSVSLLSSPSLAPISVPLCYRLQHPHSTTMSNAKRSGTAAKPPPQKKPASTANPASASASATLPPARPARPVRTRPKAKPEQPEPAVEPKRKHRNKEEMAIAREADASAKAAAAVEKEIKLAARLNSMQAVAEMENKMAAQDADVHTPQNTSHSARTLSKPVSNMASAPDFARSDSEAQQSDTEAELESEFQGEEVRSQWADQERSEEVKSKADPKFVEVDEQEDFQLTPIVKKVKTKGMLFAREAINGQRLSKHSDYAGLDQGNAKVTDPKKDVSLLVTIHILVHSHAHPR